MSQYGTPYTDTFDYGAFINDTGSMPSFDADSPAPGFIDPTSTLINPVDTAPSPATDQAFGSYRSPSNYMASPIDNKHNVKTQIVQQGPMAPRKVESSASPESSSQDSSSDSSGRRKRKSPDSSSPSTTFDLSARRQVPGRAGVIKAGNPRIDSSDSLTGMAIRHEQFGQDTQMQRLATDMSSGFLLESARNSPKGSAMTPALAQAGRHMMTPRSVGDSSMQPFSAASMFDFASTSRENSPATSDFKPMMNNLSPPMMAPDYNLFPDSSWPNTSDAMMHNHMMITSPMQSGMLTVNPNEIQPQQVFGYSTGQSPQQRPQPTISTELHVNKIPSKSRVETQIAIKLTLDPLPFGITKVHLPTSCIAKAKLLAKEVVQAADTLELSAMVFCTSALQKPENRERALKLARGEIRSRPIQPPRRSSGDGPKKDEPAVDPNDPNLPQNGGEVKICDNCIHREHKRANRKKLRKEEDEAVWDSYEKDRTIFFNTAEYQNFHTPTPLKEGPESPAPTFSAKAMQIDAPMRIGCYCRHMNEKIGFQVIFTIKDWQGNYMAQAITQSILITDDHKTHGPSLSSGQDFGFHEQQFPVGGYVGGDPSGMLQGGLPHRQFKSFTDLPSLHRQQASWGNSALSQDARTLSRPASPTSQSGPKKKRKGSGGGPKLPAGLMMTRADQTQGLAMDMPGLTPTTSYPADQVPFSAGGDSNFGISTQSMPGAYITNPPTPNGNTHHFQTTPGASAANEHFYSVPNSAYASRAASPVSFHRNPMANYLNQQNMSAAMAANFSSAQMGAETPSASHQPTLWEVNPNKGPIAGGIKVTCLGYHFHDGLNVYFDDTKASGIKLWGENTLTCFLPARAATGTVQVTLRDDRNAYQLGQSVRSIPKGAIPFEYFDDSKRQLFESFVRIMSFQQGGTGADPVEYAQAMINQAVQNSAAYGNSQNSGLGGSTGNKMAIWGSEEVLLNCLHQMHVKSSGRRLRLDLQIENGRTALSLACDVGYADLASALLAAGADADLPDINGMTALMAAAMHDHEMIVRRLIAAGADTTMRDLRGLTAAEMAASDDVLTEIGHIRRHVKHLSVDNRTRSRQDSDVSNRSLWGLPSSNASSSMFTTDDSALDSEDDENDSRFVSRHSRSAFSSRHSRRDSNVTASESDSPCNLNEVSRKLMQIRSPSQQQLEAAHAGLFGKQSGYALMTAWRDSLAAQIHLFQQTAAKTIPDIRLTLPSLQDQQGNPWRRLSSLVPHMSSTSSTTPRNEADNTSDNGSDTPDSATTMLPPPSYSEIFPQNTDMPFDSKPPELTMTTSRTSAGPMIAGSSRRGSTALTEGVSPKSRRPSGKYVMKPLLLKGGPIDEDQVHEIRQMREEISLTRAMDDRKLWYIWTPLLILFLSWWYFGLQLPPVFTKGISSLLNRTMQRGGAIEQAAL